MFIKAESISYHKDPGCNEERGKEWREQHESKELVVINRNCSKEMPKASIESRRINNCRAKPLFEAIEAKHVIFIFQRRCIAHRKLTLVILVWL